LDRLAEVIAQLVDTETRQTAYAGRVS
jgi:hypothetical protein